jgi:hypothetical protein
METISYGGYYPKPSSNDGIDRATTGVFSSGWESFKRDWESLKLDWKSIQVELNTLDGQSRDKFLEKAKEATLRLKNVIDSE